MKSRTFTSFIAMTLFAALAMPVPLFPQDDQHSHKHHHYQVIDIGTFGGPESFFNALNLTDRFGFGTAFYQFAQVRNKKGILVGFADTVTPDPFPAFCYTPDCFVSHAFQWQKGVKTDLGVLPNGASSAAFWINSEGLIVGNSQNGEIDPLIPGLPEVRAVLWKRGEIADLGTLGGNESFAEAVNDRGQITGLALNTIPDPFSFYYVFLYGSSDGTQTRAFLWDEEEGMQDLGTLGGPDAFPSLINQRGQVAGFSYTNSTPDPNTGLPTYHPFLWEKGKGMQDLGSFGGAATASVNGLNERGEVVGGTDLPGDTLLHPFLWDGKKLIDLIAPPFAASANGEASWINEAGEVVGLAGLAVPCADSGSQVEHAFLWRNGVMTDLGTVAGTSNSQASFINSKTQIVGLSFACDFSVFNAILWENGSMVDLNKLIPANSPFHLYSASFIDDRGQIAAYGFLDDFDTHALLLIPCDENNSDSECEDQGAADARGKTRPNVVLPENVRQRLRQRMGFFRFLGTPQKVALSGAAAISGPNAILSPTSLTFSTQAIGTTSAAKTVTLKNTGTTSLTISSIAITGTNAGNFAQTHTCGSSLAAGASCGISVTFRPTASGTRTAAVSISDNAGGSPQKVTLSGIGTTAKLSPVSLTFSTQAIGTISGAKKITLTNAGMTSLNITGITITGTNAGEFAQTHTCGSSLSAGASCSITVTFKPTASGTRTAALSISDNAAGSPQKVTLSGIGTTAELSPTSLSFGTVAICPTGTLKPPKTVTLTNLSTTALSITGIAITGTDAGDFGQTQTCGSSLAAGASCTISVRFRPTAIGTRRAALSITDNAAGSPQKVALSGTGGACGLGYCLVNSGNALTGYCIGQLGGMCRSAYDPLHCPSGQQGDTPGVFQCQVGNFKVDASRSCTP